MFSSVELKSFIERRFISKLDKSNSLGLSIISSQEFYIQNISKGLEKLLNIVFVSLERKSFHDDFVSLSFFFLINHFFNFFFRLFFFLFNFLSYFFRGLLSWFFFRFFSFRFFLSCFFDWLSFLNGWFSFLNWRFNFCNSFLVFLFRFRLFRGFLLNRFFFWKCFQGRRFSFCYLCWFYFLTGFFLRRFLCLWFFLVSHWFLNWRFCFHSLFGFDFFTFLFFWWLFSSFLLLNYRLLKRRFTFSFLRLHLFLTFLFRRFLSFLLLNNSLLNWWFSFHNLLLRLLFLTLRFFRRLLLCCFLGMRGCLLDCTCLCLDLFLRLFVSNGGVFFFWLRFRDLFGNLFGFNLFLFSSFLGNDGDFTIGVVIGILTSLIQYLDHSFLYSLALVHDCWINKW